MLLCLVKHLPTSWNVEGRLQGNQNAADVLPLNDSQRETLQQERATLQGVGPFDMVLTSSLRRTQQTADLYGFSSALIEPLLDELDFGVYSGRFRSALDHDLKVGHPKLGEDPAELGQRIQRFVDKYRSQGKVLAFGHGAWIRGLISIVKHRDLRLLFDFQTVTAGVIQLEFS